MAHLGISLHIGIRLTIHLDLVIQFQILYFVTLFLDVYFNNKTLVIRATTRQCISLQRFFLFFFLLAADKHLVLLLSENEMLALLTVGFVTFLVGAKRFTVSLFSVLT